MNDATNIAGDLDVAMEEFLTAAPQADIREASNFWFWDDEGRIGGPRIAVEAWGRDWSQRMARLNLAFPDGRVLWGEPHFDERAYPEILSDRSAWIDKVRKLWGLQIENETKRQRSSGDVCPTCHRVHEDEIPF